MQSTQWTIHDLSRTDHNKHSACEYKRLHKYGGKLNAFIQIMVKRLTSKTVVLMFLTIIQYNTWLDHTQLLLHIVSLRGYISQSHTWISIRLIQKQWEKGKKCILCYTLYFDISSLQVRCTNIKEYMKKYPAKKENFSSNISTTQRIRQWKDHTEYKIVESDQQTNTSPIQYCIQECW